MCEICKAFPERPFYPLYIVTDARGRRCPHCVCRNVAAEYAGPDGHFALEPRLEGSTPNDATFEAVYALDAELSERRLAALLA